MLIQDTQKQIQKQVSDDDLTNFQVKDIDQKSEGLIINYGDNPIKQISQKTSFDIKELEDISQIQENQINQIGVLEIRRNSNRVRGNVVIPDKTISQISHSPIKVKSIKLDNVQELFEQIEEEKIRPRIQRQFGMAVEQNVEEGMPVYDDSDKSDDQEGLIIPQDINNERNYDNDYSVDEEDGQNQNPENNFMEDLLANNLNSDNQKVNNSQIVSSTRQLKNKDISLRTKSKIEKISYFKLNNHIKHNHPRNKLGEPFSICQDIGQISVLNNDSSGNKDENKIPYIQNEIGLGASLLLVTLKAFAVLFFILSIVNIPTMALYAYGNKQQLDSFNAQQFFAMLSLGNIGQTQGTCNIQNLQSDSNMSVSCAFGTLTSLVQYGITLNDSSTCNPDSQDILMVPTCTKATQLFQPAYQNDLINYFNLYCKGNTKCTIPFDSTKLSNKCNLIIQQRNQISKYNKTIQNQKQQQQKKKQKNNQNQNNQTQNNSQGQQNQQNSQQNNSNQQVNNQSGQQNQSNGQQNLININQQSNKNKTNDKNRSLRLLQKNNNKNNNSQPQNNNKKSSQTGINNSSNSQNNQSVSINSTADNSSSSSTNGSSQQSNSSQQNAAQSIQNSSSSQSNQSSTTQNSSQNISSPTTDSLNTSIQNNFQGNSTSQIQSDQSSSANNTQAQTAGKNLNKSQIQQNNNNQTSNSTKNSQSGSKNTTQNNPKSSQLNNNNQSSNPNNQQTQINTSSQNTNSTQQNNSSQNSSINSSQINNLQQNLGTISPQINSDSQNQNQQQQNILDQTLYYNNSEPRIIMYAQCNSSNIVIPGPDIVISKQKLGMVVVWIDIISIIIIIFFAKILKRRQGEYVKLFNKSTIKISDFTVRVKNLPFDREFDGDENILKAQLWEHFALFLEKNNQVDVDNKDQKILQISDITFAKQEIKETAELIQLYDKYLNLQNLLHDKQDRKDNKEAFEQKIQKAEKNYINQKKQFSFYQKFQETKENLRASIRKVKNFENAQDDIKNQKKKSIRYAFITFRSMKALNSVLNHQQKGYFEQVLSMNCCNKQIQDQPDKYQSSYFYNRQLNVKKASQPDEIKWENFGYHGHCRIILRILVWLIALGLIVGDIFGMVALKYQNDKLKNQFNYNQVCSTGFTKAQAYSDYVDNNSTQGLMGCYCQQQFNLDIASIYSISFADIDPDDIEPYCADWLVNQTKQDAILIAMSIFIIIFNLLISKILELISGLERHHTEDELSLSQFQKILITNFTNLAVVILLVNFNTYSSSGGSVDFILNGDYTDFSVQWYRNIGTTICTTLVINIFSPYMLSLLKYVMQNIQRCKDRKFRRNLKLVVDEKSDLVNTQLVLQSDLQALYTGSQIQTHYVYASIFSNFWACLMYSSGFPVLYLVAFLFYTVLYWVYKVLLIKFFQKTSKSNENLAIKSMSYIKYGIIIHMIIGGLMFTNINILTPIYDDRSSEIDLQDAFDITGAEYLKSRFTSNFSKIYLAFFVIFIFLFVVFDFALAKFQNCIKTYKINKSSEDKENSLNDDDENKFLSSDVFMEMKVSCLSELYKRSILELNIYQLGIKDNKEFISQEMINKHLQALKERVQSIEQVIDGHLSKLLSLYKNETKNQQNLDSLFKYNFRQKLHILMVNEHSLLSSKLSQDRLRMIGITQSYHINDSQQYQKAKKMMKILAKEGEQNYQLKQIAQDSEKKALF